MKSTYILNKYKEQVEIFAVSGSVYESVFLCSTGYCFSLVIVAGLLRHNMLNSSPSSPSPLTFPTLLRVVFILVILPVTRSLFSQAICDPPCILRVHTISTCCFPFSPKLFVLPPFFSIYFISYFQLFGGPCSSCPKIYFCI